LTGTPVVKFPGATVVTVGPVVSGVPEVPVVKLLVNELRLSQRRDVLKDILESAVPITASIIT